MSSSPAPAKWSTSAIRRLRRTSPGPALSRSAHSESSILPALLVLSALSGGAALIYEIVWFQLLELVIGASAVSVGILLAAFMAGLCLGSYYFPKLISASRNPLKVYAIIETSVAVLGIVVLIALPFASQLYTAWTGDGGFGLLLRCLVAAVALLPPTLLMGATLPLLSRSTPRTPQRASWIGWIYGANIAGGIVGCLLAGFYLLRVYDLAIATYAAAALNAVAAVLALWLSRVNRGDASEDFAPEDHGNEKVGASAIHLSLFLSGFCALAAETLWVRSLGLVFGASVYTLALVLAVYLAGLGIGSAAGAMIGERGSKPYIALAWCQILAALAIAWTAYAVNGSFPFWPVNPAILTGFWFSLQMDLNRALWALLPPTLLWGATFPLAVRCLAQVHAETGRVVGGLYAANTVGAVVGALTASFILTPVAGSQRAQQLLIGISVASGFIAFLSRVANARRASGFGFAVAALAACAIGVFVVPPLSGLLVAHGRYAATWAGKGEIVYAAEGMSSSVAVSRFANGSRTFHVAGKIQASDVPRDLRLQRMLGHLTTLTSESPKSVLVIGCGAGVTAGAVSIDPAVEKITLVEIEPLVPQAAAEYFAESNFNVIKNPKVQVHIDDGRHYLMTSKERFDAITADPLDPWVKGAANLYTRDFLESARDHLNPGGVITVYVQLFETNLEAVKSLVATFLEVFPNGTAWGNTYEGQGYDMVLLGHVEQRTFDLDALDARLFRPDYAAVEASLRGVGFLSSMDLFATYAGRKQDLQNWLKGAAINTDRNLRMEFLAGFALNLDESAEIYADMIAHRRFPEGLFKSDHQLPALRASIEAGAR